MWCTSVVQNPGGACPVMLLLFLPVKPSISQIMQALLQKDVIDGLFPQMGGCALRNTGTKLSNKRNESSFKVYIPIFFP